MLLKINGIDKVMMIGGMLQFQFLLCSYSFKEGSLVQDGVC